MPHRINVKLLFWLLIGTLLLGNVYTFQTDHSVLGKSVNSTKIAGLKSKITQQKQQLRKKAAELLAPCLTNPTNPANILQCQAALNQYEMFLETGSQTITGWIGEIHQLLRNIH
jgi:type III secretion apparatus needle protein